MERPEKKYASSGDVYVAYQCSGKAPSKVGGIAVHIDARAAGAAAPGEVLVSSTVKDLVSGSRVKFEDRGTYELKGILGEWRLFEVDA